MKHFVVVGAGLGGLAVALRLAHRGHRVTVLEKTDQVGGRNREVQVGPCRFDGGPTLLMMLDPFRQLFQDVGERIEDHLDLSLCDPSYRVFFADGERVDATTDVERMLEQIRTLSGALDAESYPRMLRDLAALYNVAIPNFVRKNFYSPADFFGGRALPMVAEHKMLGNYGRRMAKYYADPRLQMLFSFQAMYLGLSPFEAPWVYATLTYMEYGEGIWYAKGGVVEVCLAVARLAEARGVDIRLASPVAAVTDSGVQLATGERLAADVVICNADLPYAEAALLPPSRNKRRGNSCSAYMLYVDYEGQLPDLLHHNVFFGADFKGNLRDIFRRRVLPEDPAFYACISARTDPSRSAPGHDNLMILLPCPNLERPWDPGDGAQMRRIIFERLRNEVGFDDRRIRGWKEFTPIDWRDSLNLHDGATFGLSHHLWQSAYFRPANRSSTHPNVYFVGASTVPGNGLPMVLISAELAEDRLRHDGFIE